MGDPQNFQTFILRHLVLKELVGTELTLAMILHSSHGPKSQPAILKLIQHAVLNKLIQVTQLTQVTSKHVTQQLTQLAQKLHQHFEVKVLDLY